MGEGLEGDLRKRRDRRGDGAWIGVEAYAVLRSLDIILEALRNHGQFFSSKLDFIWFGGKKLYLLI